MVHKQGSEDHIKSIAKNVSHGSIRSYVTGLFVSLVLTVSAYATVVLHWLTPCVTTYVLVTLALIQAIIQMVYFLHLYDEARPRWKQIAFYFMLTVIVIIVGGTLWIMNNLVDRTMSMTPVEMREHLHHQE